MRLPALAAVLLICLSAEAGADTLAMPEAPQAVAPIAAKPGPTRGAAMSAVLRQYGQPSQKHAAVGGDAPLHPPITRWDYDAFSVFFERDRVVDVVKAGEPAHVVRTEGLQ